MSKETIKYGKIWEEIIVGDNKSIVCFSNGTCVIFIEEQEDLEFSAIKLLREWGPVHVGFAAGDFSTISLEDYPGWAVTCHHNDILTYVDPSEGDFDADDDLTIGLYGRSKRDIDAAELNVVHIRKSF